MREVIHGINHTSPASWDNPAGVIDRTRIYSTGAAVGWTPGNAQNAPGRMLAYMEAAPYAVTTKEPGAPNMGYAGGKLLGTVSGMAIWTADATKQRFEHASVGLIGGSATPAEDAVAVVRVDELADYAAGQIFRDQSAIFGAFGIMRHLGPMQINGSTRAEIMAPSGHDLSQGLSLPEAVALTARCGIKAGWYPLPHLITDANARVAFVWADKNAPAGAGNVFEFSNEIGWGGFPQSAYARSQDGGNGDTWIGQRIAALTKQAAGLDVKIVVMSQFANPQRFKNVWAAFVAAGGDKSKIGGIGCAFYNDVLQSLPNGQLMAMVRANDIAGAIASLTANIPAMSAQLGAYKALADGLGVPLMIYEHHCLALVAFVPSYPIKNADGTAISTADQNAVLTFQKAVMADARVVALWNAHVAALAAGGVTIACAFNFNHMGSVSGGYWGLWQTPLWAALTEPPAPVVVPPTPAQLLGQVAALVAQAQAAMG